jgi:hypothetical protein
LLSAFIRLIRSIRVPNFLLPVVSTLSVVIYTISVYAKQPVLNAFLSLKNITFIFFETGYPAVQSKSKPFIN